MSVPVRGRDEVIFGGKSKAKQKDPAPTPEIEAAINNLDANSTAGDYKAVGNLCFGHKMFSAAIKHYTAAIERDPTNEILLSNRSAAYVQSILLSGPSMALKDAKKAIELKPDWFKGHLRAGDAFFAQKKLIEAMDSYQQCLRCNPDCTTAQDSIAKCQAHIEEEASGGASPEKAPYQEEGHGQQKVPGSPGKREVPPEEERLDTETLIKTWSRDTDTDTTSDAPFKKYNASVEEADRQAGQQAKNAWMSSFRKKVESNNDFKENLETRLEKDKLKGDGHNYRGQAPRQFHNGTDSVGMAISTDAYKSHKYMSSAW